MATVRISLKYNILSNYTAQIYVMAIGIVMAPVYLHYMGTEAYGLIGFFTMMTAWFQLLDLGLTPTLVRETARYRGGAIGVDTLRVFLRTLEVIFGVVSITGAAAMILFAGRIATHWLQVKELPIQQVAQAVMLMGLAVPMRWISGLYRGVVNGFERQVWLGGYNIFIATARFVGVLAVFGTLGASPVHFFAYQLVVALIELAGLAAMTYSLVRRGSGPRQKFSFKPLMGNLTFSLIIAFTATVWVVATQTDKLILSKFLPLAEYGMFSIAVVAASAINAAGGPFGQAILPRLTKLAAEKNEAGVAKLYGEATQAVCVLVAPAVAILCFFASPILLAWTGRPDIAHHAAPILSLYAIGNGWVALGALPYYLQYAKGDLRLHFIGNVLVVALLLPLVFWGATHYGGVGTGAVWALVNGLYVLCWIPVVHARVFKGQHWKWMIRNILPIAVPTVLAGWALAALIAWPAGRWATLAVAAAAGVVLLAVAGCGSSIVRHRVMMLLAPLIARIAKERA
jgi:O-antigen/teichoic acid export membrane protein